MTGLEHWISKHYKPKGAYALPPKNSYFEPIIKNIMNELPPKEQQRIEQLQLQIDWIKEKFPLQYLSNNTWVKLCNPTNPNWGIDIFRRKPAKKVVPLEASDIELHRDLFRYTYSQDCISIYPAICLSEEGVIFCTTFKDWTDLMRNYQRSTDGGKTWQPCSKEVEG